MTPPSIIQVGSASADALARPLSPAAHPRERRAPRRPPRRALPELLRASIALSIALITHPAHGLPPTAALDEEPLVARTERLDLATDDHWFPEPTGAPLWLSIDTHGGQRPSGEVGFSAMLVLGLPLDRLAAHRPARLTITETPSPAPDPRAPRPDPRPAPPPPTLKPPAHAPRAEPPPPGDAAKLPPPSAPLVPLRIPVIVTPNLARAAVDAALRHAHLLDPSAQADALASRARRAALLPELRVRVSRTIDEGQTLSPTEYDPLRRTATGGTSLWLEARTTWRLDRLVFADEELTLERMREHRAALARKLTSHVLERLFTWQRALALADDPSASPEENLAARLHAIEAEAELDLLTAGWLSAFRAGAAAEAR